MAQLRFQDWSRYSAPSADTLEGNSVIVGTTFQGGILDVSLWSNLWITFTNNDASSYMKVTVFWFGFQGGIPSSMSDVFVVGPGQTGSMSMPTKHRQAQIQIDAINIASISTFTYSIIGVSHNVSRYEAKTLGTAIVNDSTAYAASGSKTLLPVNWYEGPVQIVGWGTNGTPGHISLAYYDFNVAGFVGFALEPVLSVSTTQTLFAYFPAAPIQAFISNDGAAQTINVQIVPAGRV